MEFIYRIFRGFVVWVFIARRFNYFDIGWVSMSISWLLAGDIGVLGWFGLLLLGAFLSVCGRCLEEAI